MRLTVTLLTLLLVVLPPRTSHASDYYHECGLPGGQYKMHDEILYEGSGASEKQLEYKTLSKVTLSETEGYCVGKTGKRYGFRSERYFQHVEIRQNGQPIKLNFYCELASDGLPANETCVRQVQTRVKRLVPAYNTKTIQTPEVKSGE